MITLRQTDCHVSEHHHTSYTSYQQTHGFQLLFIFSPTQTAAMLITRGNKSPVMSQQSIALKYTTLKHDLECPDTPLKAQPREWVLRHANTTDSSCYSSTNCSIRSMYMIFALWKLLLKYFCCACSLNKQIMVSDVLPEATAGTTHMVYVKFRSPKVSSWDGYCFHTWPNVPNLQCEWHQVHKKSAKWV